MKGLLFQIGMGGESSTLPCAFFGVVIFAIGAAWENGLPHITDQDPGLLFLLLAAEAPRTHVPLSRRTYQGEEVRRAMVHT